MGLYQYLHYLCTLNSQDMSTLPQHKSSLLAASGVCLRRINAAGNEYSPITYAHQDDYYIFGLVEGSTGGGVIDFKEQRFAAGDMFLIQPGQVHRFLNAESAEGWLLIADSLGINDHAYFSRMFTQATGVSPTLFRLRNRG